MLWNRSGLPTTYRAPVGPAPAGVGINISAERQIEVSQLFVLIAWLPHLTPPSSRPNPETISLTVRHLVPPYFGNV